MGPLEILASSGSFSQHMALHILLMNLAAPILAALAYSRWPTICDRHDVPAIVAVAIAHTCVLLAWHLPPAMALAMVSRSVEALMQVTLFVTALCFWYVVFAQARAYIWRALVTLLITGKLYCLLAALLVFAPRVVYTAGEPGMSVSLADQQLAGLMMVVACPLSYVLIATVLAARWLGTLHRQNAIPPAPTATPTWS
ncbi:MAG: cytochrome c oxidase assembly protein [Halioglobus sp.]|nr:cytochrome c oxidase assembly protein [Caldilineaceae bacterium]MCB1689807.1 cytochrome c oxidase assembly protein [Halioglobus sp.]